MRRLSLARDAAILAAILPASVLRQALGAALSGKLALSLTLIAAIPELEAIAVGFIFEELTA